MIDKRKNGVRGGQVVGREVRVQDERGRGGRIGAKTHCKR